MTDYTNPETLVLHAGYRSDPATGSVAVPIYQTTAYEFSSTEQASNLFSLSELGNIYSRIMHPTADILEKRITSLEGGVGALALSSGQSASAFSVQNIAQAGDNIVCSTDIYGGTWNLFNNTLRQQGIEVRFVDPIDPNNFKLMVKEGINAWKTEGKVFFGPTKNCPQQISSQKRFRPKNISAEKIIG